MRGFVLFCLFLVLIQSCKNRNVLFEKISSDHSGIHFNNKITETDSVNVLDISNVYNGGGVGIGDFNQDGLQDIYFSGNLVSNKLYLNKGDFRFEDITEAAGVSGGGKWCRGVAVVDINNDGLPDIYVCATIKKNPKDRENLLYVNQGNDKNGIPVFKEMAKEYGLADDAHSTQAAFFDFDNDGDLDVYVSTNEINNQDYPNHFRMVKNDGSNPSTGRLYRNDWNAELKHPVFTDVSKQAGVTYEGYAHSVTITDMNKDGWKDIYVSNDYLSNDLLYINNHDGTFSEQMKDYFKHTSTNAMGNDITDINNDGLEDVVTLDMAPEDNYRKKMMMMPNSYQTYLNSDQFGYGYQYSRNTLQINQGPRVLGNDSVGAPVFSEIGFYAGIAETDWSWTPMVADFDNDGYRDIIVTNGFPKDVTDHDFVLFRNKAFNLVSKTELLKQIPEVKLHKYAFRNNGNLRFTNVSKEWGVTTTAFSNGTAYADFDNDGDLDFVVNNINDEAMIFMNTAREKDKEKNHFLQVQCIGDAKNRDGLGAWIELHYDHGKEQVYENSPYRGYLTTIQNIAHFGLGTITKIDTLLVKWPNGKMQELFNVPADQVLKVDVKNANTPYSFTHPLFAQQALFREISDSVNLKFTPREKDYIDFNIQKLIPHKLSEYGPALATGDINGDGIEDLLVGGSTYYNGQKFLQQKNGRFVRSELPQKKDTLVKQSEDEGMILFDADGDGDLDLFIASGSCEAERNTVLYRDQFFLNDGKGNFTLDTAALPNNFTSKFCVRAADYDHDGDLDLFISGRVDPGNYPKPVSSFIYRNDSQNGKVKFTDVTATAAKSLVNLGMVCDAIWTDFDNDGWVDLVLAGEWMPVTFLKNNNGNFVNVTSTTGIDKHLGWWSSIAAGDFDNDGDIDYIVSNLGTNSFYRASDKYPVRVYAKDFDNNGIYDMIPSLYLPDKNGELQEFPAHTRDDLLRQINAMRKKFPDYKTYALATMDKVVDTEQRKGALILTANDFNSSYLRNDGNGKFTILPLPAQVQFSAVNGMIVDDFDGDGNLDVLMNTNDFGTEPVVGRYDALNGLLLKGDGKGNFIPQSILESGIFIPGNGKALAKFRSADGKLLVAGSQNRGPLKLFTLNKTLKQVEMQPSDNFAILKFKNGTTRRQENYCGFSFLSQSSRIILLNEQIASIEVTDNKGNKRNLAF